jgi:hypothetical protein
MKNVQDVGTECEIETVEPARMSPIPDPSDPIIRNQLFRAHPMRTGRFKIATPPIRDAFSVMSHVIASGAPCAGFVAFPRFGKTSTIEYCKQRLEDAFPATSFVRFHANHNDTRAMANRQYFFRDLLWKSMGVELPLSRRKDFQQLLSRAWWGRTRDLGSDTLVLLADEMQAWNADQYSWLIDITNDLQLLEVNTISILFGQPQLIGLRSTLRSIGRGDILGRFMARIFPFEGIKSPTDLQSVMAAYDDPAELEYPEGSGWAFTRFYLPKAYSSGFRLANSAADCWSVFQELGAKHMSESDLTKLSIGMQWIVGTFQHLLFRAADADRQNFRVTLRDWRDAVRSTEWVKSLSDVYSPQMADKLWLP